MTLTHSRDNWRLANFNEVLIKELQELPVDSLPLQQGLTRGSYVLDLPRKVMVIDANGSDYLIRARVGVFYTSVIGGCSCTDDPSTIEEINEYCEIDIEIDLSTAAAKTTLVV